MNTQKPEASIVVAQPAPEPGRRITKVDLKRAHVGGSVCLCRGTGEIEHHDETLKLRASAAGYVVGSFLMSMNDVKPLPLMVDPRGKAVKPCARAMKQFAIRHRGQFINTESGPRWIKGCEPEAIAQARVVVSSA